MGLADFRLVKELERGEGTGSKKQGARSREQEAGSREIKSY
jgi:hypothetical protein